MWLHLRRQGHDVARCTDRAAYRRAGLGRGAAGQAGPHHDRRTRGATGRPTWSTGTSPPPPRTSCGSRTSPTSRPGPASSTSRSSSTSSPAAIVGWRAATTMTTDLVLDTLEMAIWTAASRPASRDLTGLVHHTDAGSQYTSFAFTSRLIEAGVDPSVGSVGDAYDNALAESQIGALQDRADPARRTLARPSSTSSSRPWTGSTGSTTSAPTSRSTTSPRSRPRSFTTLHETVSRRPAETPNRSLRKLRGGSP